MPEVVFREAASADEIHQLQRLNHRTFAEELGQHALRADAMLVDRFHGTNRYFVAVEDGCVLGMISINLVPPFSVEKRLPAGVTIGQIAPDACEVRLLAISQEARRGVILGGLFWKVFLEVRRQGKTHVLISGLTERRAMYESLGFRALGPPIQEGKASFMPMVLDLQEPSLLRRSKRYRSWWERREPTREVRLLPGPVQLSAGVQRAFARAPVSHRDAAVVDIFEQTRRRLTSVAGGMPVAVMTGSGTLANDAVAACLRSCVGGGRGLVLANGEFGGRLAKLARRAGLCAQEMSWEWGTAWDHDAIEKELQRASSPVEWVWGVHLETSTGQVNDLERLARRCNESGVVVIADCVSSLGALPLPTGLFLASGVSGKSLGSYAGLSFVFAGARALERIRSEELPATFDIVQAIERREPMFTVPSPQLLALYAALEENYADEAVVQHRFAHYADLGERVRSELRARGFGLVATETAASPPITSFTLPSPEAMQACYEAGFRIAHQSGYLRQRNWAQISVMGALDEATIEPIFDLLGKSPNLPGNAPDISAGALPTVATPD